MVRLLGTIGLVALLAAFTGCGDSWFRSLPTPRF